MEELKPVLTSLSDISRVIKFKEDLRRVSKIHFAHFDPMLVSDRCIDSKDLKTHSIIITSTFMITTYQIVKQVIRQQILHGKRTLCEKV